jgi:putative ABC transport system permease protein
LGAGRQSFSVTLSRQNLRLAARSFARHPGFTAIAIVSLALAIALNTTMYSVLDAMIRPNFDARDPGQIYALTVWGDYKHTVDDATRRALVLSSPDIEAVSYESTAWGGAAIEYGTRYTQAVQGIVDPNLFQVLGAHPLRGRAFTEADVHGETSPVMISDRLAATLSPDGEFPIGTTILMNGVRAPVIGIYGRGFLIPGSRADIVTLLAPGASRPVNIVRVRHGVSGPHAEQSLRVPAERLAVLARMAPEVPRLQLKPVAVSQFSPQRFQYALAAAVIAVLLVACANLANLQLARGIGRARELAVRAALGASRANLVGQLLIESAFLALAGLAAGVVLTYWGVHLLRSRIPPSVAQYVIEPQISWRVFAFAVAAAIVCTMLVGLYPAVRVSRVDPNALLKAGAGTGALKRHRRQYGVMVGAQIGLSLALLSGATLVVRTAIQVHSLDVGFDTRRLVSASLFLQASHDTALSRIGYANEVLSHLRAVPDLADAAMYVNTAPDHYGITVNERGGTPREVKTPLLSYSVVTPGYFRTMGRQIVHGRDFADGAAAVPEIVIDEHTATSLFSGVDPIGLQIKLGDFKSQAPWLRIVGVVAEAQDYRQVLMYRREIKPSRIGAIYRVMGVGDTIRFRAPNRFALIQIVARAKADPDRLAVELRGRLPSGALVRGASVAAMEEAMGIRGQRQSHDFVASVFLTFAALGVGLAALGIYGIVAHSVAERRRELGVRIALGASVRDILHAVLREGNVTVLAGIAIGLYLTKNTAGWLHAFIFEDDEYNAPVFAAVAIVLFAVAFFSALWPALRATRIDPVESLRSE